jgi:hypothetical protein
MSSLRNLVGQRFGRLVVVARDGSRSSFAAWSCQCDCGKTKTVIGVSLTGGKTTSCGCYAIEACRAVLVTHGMTKTRTWSSWSDMLKRCRNPNATGYENYGGRGITVCARWETFENFIADMGECPPGLTLERENVDRDYEPSNCRWATKAEQQNNKRNTRWVEIDGQRMSLGQACKRRSVSYSLVRDRLKLGWSLEAAISEPKRFVVARP